MLQAKPLKAMRHRPVFRRELKRVRTEPTLEQQIQAIKDLGNLLTEEEREVFSKVMNDIEEGKHFKNERIYQVLS